MFSLVSGVYDAYLAPTKLNLLVVGASGVGKTALLERLKVSQFTKNKKPAPASSTKRHKQQDELLTRPPAVPDVFLPLVLREKQRDLDDSFRRHSQHSQRSESSKKKKKQPAAAAEPKRPSFLRCPAPSRYSNAHEESSDDDDCSIDEEEDGPSVEDGKPARHGMSHPQTSQDLSLEDVNLDQSETAAAFRGSSRNGSNGNGEVKEDDDSDDDDDQQQHDLKDKSKHMLPLHKIRPTIGMNLAKVEMCSAHCHVWDLGGKMHDLWSRYYQDCDAVVFVWKIVDDSEPVDDTPSSDGNDSDDDRLPHVSAAQQLALLEQVRDSIPDDVPLLIWGHWFPTTPDATIKKKKNKAYRYNKAYSTGALLPHYHNPLMSVYFGSTKSGVGVRSAMEWLIPIAVRQKKFRDKDKSESQAGGKLSAES